MDTKTITLAYQNEDDRAYGLAGMTISLAALRAIDRVVRISLDSDGPMVEFSHEYYFSGSPSISPKATWDNLVQNFHITTAMVVSNILARSMVRLKNSEVPHDLLDVVLKEVHREGMDTCGLDEDEIDNLYNHALNRSHRLFSNPRFHPAVDELARVISRRRELSGMEIQDELHILQII